MANENLWLLDDYKLELKEETKLYQRGVREQWDTDTLPWEIGTRLGRVEKAAGARILSQFLHGEQAAMVVASQLLPMVGDIEARYFLTTQIIDEGRHVESFYRYVNLLGEKQPANSNMRELLDKILNLPSVPEKLVGMHLLMEGLAQEVFHDISKTINDPLLQELLGKIALDETRHVAFGTVYLKKLVAGMDGEARERLVNFQAQLGMLFAGLVTEEAEASVQFGLDLEKVTKRAIKVHFRRLQEVGLF